MAKRKAASYELVEIGYRIAIEFAVYLFAVVGIFFSQFLNDFRQGTLNSISFNWASLIMSAVIACSIVFADDATTEKRDKEVMFKKRALSALTQGFMWSTILRVQNP